MCLQQLLFKILFLFQKTFPFALGNSPPGNLHCCSDPTFSQWNIASVQRGVKVSGGVFENNPGNFFEPEDYIFGSWISVKILLWDRSFSTRPRGVFPSAFSESRSAF